MSGRPPQAAWNLAVTNAIEAAGGSSTGSTPAEEVIELFDRFRDRLLRYVLSFSLPVQDAEDIVQEVFLALFRHLRSGRSRSNLRAWIFRVAHNLALKRRTHVHTASLTFAGEGAVLADLLPDPDPNPEDQAAATQRRGQLLAVVAALSEQDRRCLVLRAEGLRYREIAQVLDISLGAVALSLERSLMRLTRAVQR